MIGDVEQPLRLSDPFGALKPVVQVADFHVGLLDQCIKRLAILTFEQPNAAIVAAATVAESVGLALVPRDPPQPVVAIANFVLLAPVATVFGEPDERYTDWFRSSYLRVFENKVPERDICDTLTRYACDGRRDRRLQYDRVVLPARLSCGTPALVMDSHVAGELCPLGT